MIEDTDGNGCYIPLRVKTDTWFDRLFYHQYYRSVEGDDLEITFDTELQAVREVSFLVAKKTDIFVQPKACCFESSELKIIIPNESLNYNNYSHVVKVTSVNVVWCGKSDIMILIDDNRIMDLKCYYFDENNGILFYGNEVAGVHMKNITDEEKQELLRYRTYDEETHSWRDLREKVGPPVKLMTPYVKKQE